MSFLELQNSREYLWPKKGNRLLRPSNDRRGSFDFISDQTARHVFMWDGYFLAGATLVKQSQDQVPERDALIYPILSCYRQGLELAMKWIVSQYGGVANIYLDDDDLDHNLWKLWVSCRVVIKYSNGEAASEDVAATEQIIKDFHDLDYGGAAFRYAARKDGRPINLPGSMYELQNLGDTMKAVGNFFDGLDGMLHGFAGAVDSYY